LYRAKSGRDHATPSGNGVAALALNRLGHLVNEPRYSEAAERTVRAFKLLLEQEPAGHTSLGTALAEILTPPSIVVLRGAAETAAWQREINRHYLPHTLAIAVPADVCGLPAVLEKPATTAVNAWVCRGVTCLPPITDCATLIGALTARTA
jgi:uncharacterized protein YyaL (SSP411 family)